MTLCARCIIDGSAALLKAVLAERPEGHAFPEHTPSVRGMASHAAILTGFSPQDILSHRRWPRMVRVRKAIVWVAIRSTALSTTVIGKALGGRDHSTVIHARDTSAYMYDREPEFAWLCERLWAAAECEPLGPKLAKVPKPEPKLEPKLEPEPEPAPEPPRKVYQIASIRREPGEYVPPHALPWIEEAVEDEDDRFRRMDVRASGAFLAALQREHPERFAA